MPDRTTPSRPASLTDRFAALPAPGPEALVQLEPGSLRDYAELAEHHYRAQRPATVTRVLRAVFPYRSAAARFRGQAAGSLVVGVLIESLPALQCVLRDQALGGRHGKIRDIRQRAALLNAELRCVSRVIVHPQFRGLGVAVALVRHALHTSTTLYTEALAAMGHVHPFFERAGMTAYQRPRHALDERLTDALRRAGFELIDLALLESVLRRIEQLPERQRVWLTQEIFDWYRRTVGRGDWRSADVRRMLSAARTRLTCAPVYYLSMRRPA